VGTSKFKNLIFLEDLKIAQLVKKFPIFYETRGSFASSQRLAVHDPHIKLKNYHPLLGVFHP
jgi:hypothetical protein